MTYVERLAMIDYWSILFLIGMLIAWVVGWIIFGFLEKWKMKKDGENDG